MAGSGEYGGIMAAKKFEELEVWKRALNISVRIYKLQPSLKNYNFANHLGKTGLSIPSNIAEGYERDSSKEFVRFLNISRGSCGELRTQLYVGIEAGYLDKKAGEELVDETRQISAMISGLIKFRHNVGK